MFGIQLFTTKKTKKHIKESSNEFRKALMKGMKKAILFAEGEAKKSFGKPGNLKVGTGHLRRSIQSKVKDRIKVIVLSLSSNVIYAGIHEYGGVIKAKKGPYLTFKIGDRWVKVASVTMPARPFLEPAIEDNLDKMANIITSTVSKEMNE